MLSCEGRRLTVIMWTRRLVVVEVDGREVPVRGGLRGPAAEGTELACREDHGSVRDLERVASVVVGEVQGAVAGPVPVVVVDLAHPSDQGVLVQVVGGIDHGRWRALVRRVHFGFAVADVVHVVVDLIGVGVVRPVVVDRRLRCRSAIGRTGVLMPFVDPDLRGRQGTQPSGNGSGTKLSEGAGPLAPRMSGGARPGGRPTLRWCSGPGRFRGTNHFSSFGGFEGHAPAPLDEQVARWTWPGMDCPAAPEIGTWSSSADRGARAPGLK